MISNKIIQIALNTENFGLRNNFTHKATLRNKKCGDIIKIEINKLNNKIKNMRYETESCIFCQASASILSKKVSYLSTIKLQNQIKDIELYFKNEKIKLPNNLKMFREILNKKYRNRYDCIILPFNALIKALNI